MDIGRAITDYIVWHEVNRHSPETGAWYRWNLGAFARWFHATGRSTQIAEMTVADARAFLQAETQRDVTCPDHLTGVERAGKLSDRTLHCYARAIRAFFRWLVDELCSIHTLIRRVSTAARTQTRAGPRSLAGWRRRTSFSCSY